MHSSYQCAINVVCKTPSYYSLTDVQAFRNVAFPTASRRHYNQSQPSLWHVITPTKHQFNAIYPVVERKPCVLPPNFTTICLTTVNEPLVSKPRGMELSSPLQSPNTLVPCRSSLMATCGCVPDVARHASVVPSLLATAVATSCKTNSLSGGAVAPTALQALQLSGIYLDFIVQTQKPHCRPLEFNATTIPTLIGNNIRT